MIQYFPLRNRRGRSFKGENLTDADFSHSDIRGADFTDANLTNANFSHTKAGLQLHWSIGLLIISLLLSALSGAAAGLAGVTTMGTLSPAFIKGYTVAPSIEVFLTLTVFLIVIIYRGFATGLVALPLTIAVAGPVLGSLAKALTGTGSAVLAIGSWLVAVVAGCVAIALAEAIFGVIAVIGTTVLALIVSATGSISVAIATAVAISGSTTVTVAITEMVVESEDVAQVKAQIIANTALILTKAIASAVIVVTLNLYISWCAIIGDEKHTLVRTITIAIATTGGTNFRCANLTDANFSHSTLKSTDFRSANITRTCWHKSKKLDWARIGNTILEQTAVRDLLVRGNGSHKSYVGMNLRGAKLIGADLTEANFKEADISQAILRDACLEGANLTKTQAIGTDFTNAQLTGNCGLESWNIDSTTQLEWVDCRYFYFLEYPKPRTDDRERRPSSGEFAPGDFTQLFQKVLDTVDLIFSNGFDGAAFTQSFQKVQIENEETKLEFVGIEKKGDGVFFVKVKVPSDANKEKIHSQFKQFYQETLALNTRQQQLLESHSQQLKDMRLVIDRIVAKPITDKLVLLRFGDGDFKRGFKSVTAQIWSDGHFLPTNFTGKLPPKPEIPELYQQWHQKYKNLILCYQAQGWYSRIKPLPDEVRQVSFRDIPKLRTEIQELANELKKQVNIWLNSQLFSPIQNKLRSKLNPCDRIQVTIQSEDIQMRRIP